MNIRYLGDLQRLEAKPGDRFVLTLNHGLISQYHAERLQQQWASLWVDADTVPRLLILEPGMKLGAIGQRFE